MLNVIQAIAQAPKRQLTLEEACLEFEKRQKMKGTRSEKGHKEGWIDVDPNKWKWTVKHIETPTAGARLSKVKKTASMSDVFFQVLPPAVLVEAQKDMGTDSLMFGTSKVLLADIYKMYAACLYLRAARPHVDKGKGPNVF